MATLSPVENDIGRKVASCSRVSRKRFGFIAPDGVTSLVPRPLPDFILQPWRKIGRRPGIKLRHGPEMVDSAST